MKTHQFTNLFCIVKSAPCIRNEAYLMYCIVNVSSNTYGYGYQKCNFSSQASRVIRTVKNEFLYFRKTRNLRKLLKDYQNSSYNKEKLLKFMQESNKMYPDDSIKEYESFVNSEQKPTTPLVAEYIKALSATKSLGTVDLCQIIKPYKTKVLEPSGEVTVEAVDEKGEHLFQGVDRSIPMKIQLDEQVVPVRVIGKHNMWKFLIRICGTIIIIAGISVFAESITQNVQSGLGLGSKKIKPVEDTKTTFDDVKGCEEVKDELIEIVSYLKDPKKFRRLGAKLPKGVLLAGQPGTGKTLIARAIAGEAGVAFLQASGSEFEEMFVGVGARRIRDLFSVARTHSPCIVFIDEIDAIGSKRSFRDTTTVRMTLNQLLVELDGFEQNEGIIVICATNYPESLDRALTRPGRLDKTIVVPTPDLLGRIEILEFYGQNLVLDDDVDLSVLARRTAGMTGADLFNILNIAAVKSSADGRSSISSAYIDVAFDRVVVGLERRNPMNENERRLTAYHEGGHTIVALKTDGTDKIHKATIMPRGQALGITWSIPDEKFSVNVKELQSRLDMLMGGKAAEALIFGDANVTAGCMQDLKTASSIARDMVMQYGMGMESTKAPQYIDLNNYGSMSEDLRKRVDTAVQKLLDESYWRAENLLGSHEQELHNVAKALLEYETLTRDEIELALTGDSSKIALKRKRGSSRALNVPEQKKDSRKDQEKDSRKDQEKDSRKDQEKDSRKDQEKDSRKDQEKDQ